MKNLEQFPVFYFCYVAVFRIRICGSGFNQVSVSGSEAESRR